MRSFNEYTKIAETLEEKLITIGGRAYPNFGQVVILAGGAGCFDGETLVHTENGHKKISEVEVGEMVWTFNEDTHERELKRVQERPKFNSHPEELLEIEFDNGEVVVCTENHEFYVNGEWVKAKDLNVISKRPVEKRPVYDLKIEDNHNYEITKSNLPVHNSGKGFVLENMVGIEGRTLNVDDLKELVLRTPKLKERIRERYGRDLNDLDLSDPDQTAMLHEIVADMGLSDKRRAQFYSSILAAPSERKPNIVFDVTLKNMKKVHELTQQVTSVGYKKENIHIIWVINDVDIAIEQNRTRDRVVPEDILMDTHEGVARTMNKMITGVVDLSKYMDGQITFVFNKANVDTTMVKSDKGGKYIEDFLYVTVKEPNKPPMALSEFQEEILRKIEEYVPDSQYSWSP